MASLVCRETGERYSLVDARWRSDSGGLLDLEFAPSFDRALIESRQPTLWRYREALPIARNDHIVSFGEGFTPLVEGTCAGRAVLLKLEYLFPTGSYKDRGASLLISHARALGVQRVVEDSSGNAGASIAAYAARAGIACDIYVPEQTSPAKLHQIDAYGARLHRIPGTREDTAAAAQAAAQQTYYASHVWDPFFLQGTKTFAYEIVEQLGWAAPEAVMIPTGNGTLLLGAWLGFSELLSAGVISRLPRLFGVQSAHCAPLAAAAAVGEVQPAQIQPRPTAAEGIAIARPARGAQCLKAVQATGGAWLRVSEEEISTARRDAARAGFYVEPTSAAALAAVHQVDNCGGLLVVPLTGTGLKSQH